MNKKVQVQFSKEALEHIEELRKASGESSQAGVLRAALGLYSWAYEQIQDGYTIGAFAGEKPIKEVVVFTNAKRQLRKQQTIVRHPKVLATEEGESLADLQVADAAGQA